MINPSICIPKTKDQCDHALEISQSIIERVEAGRLTKVPLLHLDELPAISGLYFATTNNGDILYIGKANDLTQHCKLSRRHKLSLAIEHGATVLQVARVDSRLAWAVEQRLIAEITPILNESVSLWWVEAEKVVKPKSKRVSTRLCLDKVAVSAIERLARQSSMSLPKYVEALLVQHAMKKGGMSKDYKMLSETRGGDRTANSNEA